MRLISQVVAGQWFDHFRLVADRRRRVRLPDACCRFVRFQDTATRDSPRNLCRGTLPVRARPQLLVQCGAGDAKQLGGFRAIAAGLRERRIDGARFGHRE